MLLKFQTLRNIEGPGDSLAPARFGSLLYLAIVFENFAHIGGYQADYHYNNNNNNNNNNHNNNQNLEMAQTAAATAAHAVNAAALAPIAVETELTSLSDTHRLTKRMDLESCLSQFDVHKNTIIRTGESQAIGGKYLQGIELDTMEECQRLCCESEGCDVYIFENKNDGYCYLFECGPPENFHCKFTRHANYTSAVLTHAARHVTETTTQHPATQPHLPTTSSISQQERELTNLKVKPDSRGDKLEVTISPAQGGGALMELGAQLSSSNVMLGIPQVSQPEMSSSQMAINITAICGRFQFRCHSGECIAVYNACDGIPQCEDGSDEGPECSGAINAAASNAATGVASKSNAEQINNNNKADAAAVLKQQTPVVIQYQQQRTQQQQQQLVAQQQMAQLQHQPQMMMLPPPINNREDSAAWANRKIVAEQQQNEVGNSADLNSRIFNHKGGLQVPTNGGATYSNNNNNLNPMYAAATLQHNGIYLPQGQDMQTTYGIGGGGEGGGGETGQILQQQGHIIVPPGVNWPQQTIPSTFPAAAGGVQIQSANYAMNPAAAVQPQIIQQRQQQLQTNQVIMQPGNNKNMVIGSEQQAQLPLQQQLQQPQHFVPPSVEASAVVGLPNASDMTQQTSSVNNKLQQSSVKQVPPEPNDDYENSEELSTTLPPKKHKHKKSKSKTSESTSKQLDPIELALEQQKQHPAPPSPVHEQYKMIHDNLAMEFRDHDGQSERPGGAVLSLTLGLLVTAALAILVGCRMRTVGRRSRRLGGKTPYAHEADFLVNGMYL